MPNNPKAVDNLKPFVPGISGNPSGKPKGTLNFKTRAKWLLEAEEEITHPVTGEKIKISITDGIDVALIKAARKGEPWAIKEVNDRLEGRAMQSVETTGEITHKFEDMTDDELESIIKARQNRLS